MILIDTSLLIEVIRDKSGERAKRLLDHAGDEEIVLSRFAVLELMMGATDDADWRKLYTYITRKQILDASPETWMKAARVYAELRWGGTTIRSTIDCCIAQIALDYNCTLIHNDRDFEAIATVRPLKHLRLDLSKASP